MSIFRQAKWITTKDFAAEKPINVLHKQADKKKIAQPKKLQNYHAVFTKRFSLTAVPVDAAVRISADDYYHLYINGSFVCMGPAQGYPTAYYYNEKPVSSFLKQGENEIEVRVYYHGLVCRAYQSADRRMGLIAEISGGDEILTATDSTWLTYRDRRYKTGDTIGYKTIFCENYDNTVKNSAPQNATEKDFDHIFSPLPVETVSVYERFPVLSTPLADGGFVYDFGQEITGVATFDYVSVKGGKINIYMGEESADNETGVRWEMRCSCTCKETVKLKGAGRYSQSDYRGFRYLAIVPEKNAAFLNVRATVRHYPFDDGYCRLETDNAMLKSVWDICKNGVKYGAQEVFVDCPTREKGQYSGDMTITGASHCILTGKADLLKKAIENILQSAAVCDGLLCVAPGAEMQEIADYSLQLPLQLMTCYRTTGDKEFLEYCLPFAERMLAYFTRFARNDGLLCDVTDKWNLVDWPENLRDGYMFTPDNKGGKNEGCHNVLNAFYIGAHLVTDEIRGILGKEKTNAAAPLIKAFNREFYNEKTALYEDCKGCAHSSLHANTLPLFFGFNPVGTTDTLADFIIGKGLTCGVYFAYFVLKALCRAGRHKEALDLIVSDKTWGKMVNAGATTCFEAWGKDDKWNTSLCHPWASAPIIILAEDILPAMPSVGRIVINEN